MEETKTIQILKDFGYTPIDTLVFKPNGRPRYKIGEFPLIGTTTVIGIRDKGFLKFWTVKESYKYMDKHWDLSKTYTKKEKKEMLLLAKKAHTVKLDKALDAGKIAHALIQQSIISGERFKPEQIKNDNKATQKEICNAYKAFLDWEKDHEVEYYACELIVGSEVHYVGGTIDAIAMVDGKLELLDWKTSSQLSEDVFLQTASYKMMLVEGGVDINSITRRVVRFDKKGEGYEQIKIRTNYTKDVETFLGCLKNYRWNRDIQKDFKVKNEKGFYILKVD